METEGEVKNNTGQAVYRKFFKRIIDFISSLFLIIILSPILIIISIIIKISSKGNILFVQKRLGENGSEFNIYKFRTMIQGAEKVGTGIFTSHDDPRITRIGHLLRKTSLDELPQLLNVLKGDMSLVGPRPPVPYHPRKYEDYPIDQKKRFSVKPGITGYAQVIGRNTLSWDERIKLDVEYIEKMSFILDLKILVKTFFVFANKKEIYNLKGKNRKSM